jgi:hypothetical protein
VTAVELRDDVDVEAYELLRAIANANSGEE